MFDFGNNCLWANPKIFMEIIISWDVYGNFADFENHFI